MGGSDFIRARQEFVEFVEALRSGDGGFVDGVRRLLSLRGALGIADFDADYMVLVAIDSESDHLPNSTAKLMSTDAWLAQCSSEERELKERNEEAVLAACERLLKKFANEA